MNAITPLTHHSADRGDVTTFDNIKIGYDNNADNDIDDAGDDLVKNEDFGGSSAAPIYDHAGNPIEDASFAGGG